MNNLAIALSIVGIIFGAFSTGVNVALLVVMFSSKDSHSEAYKEESH